MILPLVVEGEDSSTGMFTLSPLTVLSAFLFTEFSLHTLSCISRQQRIILKLNFEIMSFGIFFDEHFMMYFSRWRSRN